MASDRPLSGDSGCLNISSHVHLDIKSREIALFGELRQIWIVFNPLSQSSESHFPSRDVKALIASFQQMLNFPVIELRVSSMAPGRKVSLLAQIIGKS